MSRKAVADELKAIIDLLAYIEADVVQHEPRAADHLRQATERLRVKMHKVGTPGLPPAEPERETTLSDEPTLCEPAG